jgi:hypothetical protein
LDAAPATNPNTRQGRRGSCNTLRFVARRDAGASGLGGQAQC